MEFSRNECYAAVRSRDARFDGRFFIGVRTTGVYCRPVCPAPTPRLKNIQFYRCAAEAEQAGFRPCLRCRPESAPGTPAWRGSSSSVSRALRLIDDGYLDAHGVEALAGRLGMTARHMRRLFEEHLGVAPKAVANTRRVLLAKQLLTDSDLPVGDIAFASGFDSVRQFNAAFRELYGRPPRALRKETERGVSGDLRLFLSYRPPYAAELLWSFFARRAIPAVETVNGIEYGRTIRMSSGQGTLRIRHDPARRRFALHLSPELATALPEIIACVRRQFDLAADPEYIDAHLGGDRRLGTLVRRHPGMRLPGSCDPFETAVRAVVGQQISVVGARTILGRLVQRYGDRTGGEETGGAYFPSPERLARVRMNDIGLTGARVQTIRALAQAVAAGALQLSPQASLDDTIREWQRLPGIGPWTAQYIAMRGLSEPDAFPAGDLGLVKAWSRLTKKDETPKSLERAAEAWRPWRAYAAIHLWNSLNNA